MSERVSLLKSFDKETAILSATHQLSFADLHSQIVSVIEALKQCDINPSDKVAILSENSVEYLVLILALLHYGVIVCPLSTRDPEKVLLEKLKAIDCQTIIHSDNFKIDSFNFEQINIDGLVDLNKTEDLTTALNDLDLSSEATIIFTSGSQATPKAVVHTLGNHYYSALGSNENIKLKPDNRWLLSLPLCHVGGLSILFRTILSGATIVIPDKSESIEESVSNYNVTHLSLVSTQLQRLLDSPGFNPNSLQADRHGLQAVLVGGSKVPHSLIEKAYNKQIPIHTTYGLTEMASQVTTTIPGDLLVNLYTSGKLLNYRQIKISDENEILVKGEILFKSYVNSKSEIFDSDGWFATGDIGWLDENGYLSVSGRKDNMFISGGENISPEIIESKLLLLNEIEEVVVVPITDTEFGERPAAFIKWGDKYHLNYNDVAAKLAESLPKYMIPVKIFDFPDNYLQTDIKIDRKYFKGLINNY